MTFEWLVAVRYLRSPNRPAVLRLVTLLAVIGVAAGVTTLVIALSMNTGFRQAIREVILFPLLRAESADAGAAPSSEASAESGGKTE